MVLESEFLLKLENKCILVTQELQLEIKLQKTAANKTLLYIDGDKQTQKNYGIYFQKSFSKLYQAFDGEEGFDLFEKYTPDVVILNLDLEKKDAIDLVDDIQDLKEDVMMIAISDPCDNLDLMETLDMGCLQPMHISLLGII